jgi:hypothetical protein
LSLQWFPLRKIPSVVVVRPDQYAMALEFCELLGRVGVIRVTFLSSQIALALECAAAF